MVEATCHCGRVRLVLEHAPAEVTECNCSICRRYGTLWAYYAKPEVRVWPAPEATEVYVWGEARLQFHRCRVCGCVTHWAPADPGRPRVGINARLMEPEVLARARLHHFDGAAM